MRVRSAKGMWRFLLVGAVALSMIAAACGGDETDGGLTGSIFVSGSSTVEPISALVAELFRDQNPEVDITVEGPGTGDGFELFCNGETDISDASRPIDEDEAAACEENGVEYTELEVALDGISVLTSPDNADVTCLNFGDLYALLGPESQGIDNWSDAADLAGQVGGTGDFPDAELVITGPGPESGTYDALIELSGIEDVAIEQGVPEDDAAALRQDYQASANDNVIIDGIAGSPTSLGWVGFSFFEQNQDVVKAIEIDGGEGCVAPSFESIADGSYPLSRSLFIYVNNAKVQESDALQGFVDFYMSDEGLRTSVEDVQYVTLPDDRIEATRQAWEDATA